MQAYRNALAGSATLTVPFDFREGTDGTQPTVTTHWQPSAVELQALNAGGLVAITVPGGSLIPMTVESEAHEARSSADRICRAAGGEHTWLFVTNAWLRNEGIGIFESRNVGAYRCRDCSAVKEGEPLKGHPLGMRFEPLMGVISEQKFTGVAIKDAPDGFYWAHYGTGKAEGQWTLGKLERRNVRSGLDLVFTNHCGSDYAWSWWLESSDGGPAGDFAHTDFCENGITLYGPLEPPTIGGGLLWKLPAIVVDGDPR